MTLLNTETIMQLGHQIIQREYASMNYLSVKDIHRICRSFGKTPRVWPNQISILRIRYGVCTMHTVDH